VAWYWVELQVRLGLLFWRSFCLKEGVLCLFFDGSVLTDVITPRRSVGAVLGVRHHVVWVTALLAFKFLCTCHFRFRLRQSTTKVRYNTRLHRRPMFSCSHIIPNIRPRSGDTNDHSRRLESPDWDVTGCHSLRRSEPIF
jgi:hypothetical protein